MSACWYYCGGGSDPERCIGPVSLSVLLRSGELPCDVLVSTTRLEWDEADSVEAIAASPREDLLSKDGPTFIERVEHRARHDEKFRRALGMLRRLGMIAEVWGRIVEAHREGAERRGLPPNQTSQQMDLRRTVIAFSPQLPLLSRTNDALEALRSDMT